MSEHFLGEIAINLLTMDFDAALLTPKKIGVLTQNFDFDFLGRNAKENFEYRWAHNAKCSGERLLQHQSEASRLCAQHYAWHSTQESLSVQNNCEQKQVLCYLLWNGKREGNGNQHKSETIVHICHRKGSGNGYKGMCNFMSHSSDLLFHSSDLRKVCQIKMPLLRKLRFGELWSFAAKEMIVFEFFSRLAHVVVSRSSLYGSSVLV